MMNTKVKVGINGFGRIGRLVLRSLMLAPENHLFDVVAVNDLASPESLAYLFKYDSVYRRFPGEVCAEEGAIVINGHRVQVLAEKDPGNLPWKNLGVEVVVESTGRFTDGEKAKAHLDAGARKVIISAPASNEDTTIVIGVNDDMYYPAKHRIIWNASCTTNCLAPVAKVLQDSFGIVRGLMTTTHAYTNDQTILDFPHKNKSRGRAAALSIVPSTTGAAKAIGKVLPELKGKMNGIALRVPTPVVSMVDLVAELKCPVTAEQVNAAMKAAAEGPMKGILAYETEDLVSMDFVGDPHSSLFAPMHTIAIENSVKVFSLYYNEWGDSNRVLDLVDLLIRKGL